jgi:hypothetical protein
MTYILMRQFAYRIKSYSKPKIYRVIVTLSLENLRDAAKLVPNAILLKHPAINFTVINNTGLTEMELV